MYVLPCGHDRIDGTCNIDGDTTPQGTGDMLAEVRQLQRRGGRDHGMLEQYDGSGRTYGIGSCYERKCIDRTDGN